MFISHMTFKAICMCKRTSTNVKSIDVILGLHLCSLKDKQVISVISVYSWYDVTSYLCVKRYFHICHNSRLNYFVSLIFQVFWSRTSFSFLAEKQHVGSAFLFLLFSSHSLQLLHSQSHHYHLQCPLGEDVHQNPHPYPVHLHLLFRIHQ